MNSKRLVFLLLAVIVAGATAFMARAWLQNERAALIAQMGSTRHEAPVAAPTLQVLVARNAIHTGQIVKPDDMRWQSWPQGSLAPTYIVEGKRPLSDFVGAVARGQIAAGEPVTEGKLVLAGTRGFMAAVLQPGTRAVSMPITATSAVSGFIYAGDRVDMLLTHVLRGPTGQHSATETILRNVRVIAMDQKLDFSPGDKPDIGKTATLELTPKQTELVTLAVKMGDLSLVLRSLQDANDDGRDAAVIENAAAEPGDSFTEDSQVSKLIRPASVPATVASKPVVIVLRGSGRSKLDVDGSGDGAPSDSGGKPGENKTNKTAFTPMNQSEQQ
jgi:pilus assembly protein CpaB